ncbi:MAG: glycosyltransferase [Myxococcota bacterium]|nr:glycosyltransferase [Myxococcota bacterium]MEC9441983.1 glycosyltransferase [Myxococcota bacterium]
MAPTRRNTPLRVAHVIQYFDVGGLERMVLRLAHASRAFGISPSVFAYMGDGPMRLEFERAGIATHLIDQPVKGVQFGRSFDLTRAFEREAIDVIHSHHVGPFLYSMLAASALTTPHVHTEHSHEFYDVPRRQALGQWMDARARVVAVTEEISQWREAYLGRGCEVIHNGVPMPTLGRSDGKSVRRSLGICEGTFIIGCVARLAPEKDIDFLLRSFAKVARRKNHVALVLVGDGPERENLEASASLLGIADKVHFLGQRNDVEMLLPAFDLFALSSRREGLPLAVLEAMGHAIPVVVTAVGGLPDLLRDGGGRVVAHGDEEAMASALDSFMGQPRLRRSEGRRARARIKHSHSSEAMARAYTDIYEEMALTEQKRWRA